jgi:hypothetical protein
MQHTKAHLHAIKYAATRLTVVSLLLCALLLPKVTGLALELMPSVQTAVICAGDRLIVLRFDENMNPIEVDDVEDKDCVMHDVIAQSDQPIPAWRLLDPTNEQGFSVAINSDADQARLRAPLHNRGPPVVI